MKQNTHVRIQRTFSSKCPHGNCTIGPLIFPAMNYVILSNIRLIEQSNVFDNGLQLILGLENQNLRQKFREIMNYLIIGKAQQPKNAALVIVNLTINSDHVNLAAQTSPAYRAWPTLLVLVGVPGGAVQTMKGKGRFRSYSNVHKLNVLALWGN